MSHFKKETIDNIKEKYKYTIDYSHWYNKPDVILSSFYVKIHYSKKLQF